MSESQAYVPTKAAMAEVAKTYGWKTDLGILFDATLSSGAQATAVAKPAGHNVSRLGAPSLCKHAACVKLSSSLHFRFRVTCTSAARAHGT